MSALDTKKTCRLCGERGLNYKPIFGGREPVIHQIIRCLSITIKRHDGLPDHICSSCIACLSISYKLHILSTKTDQILRKNLLTVKTEKIDFKGPQSTQLKTEIEHEKAETGLMDKNEEIPLVGTQNLRKSEISVQKTTTKDVTVQNAFNVNYTATPVVLAVFHLPQMIFDGIENANDFNNNKSVEVPNNIEEDLMDINGAPSFLQSVDEQSSEKNKENITATNLSDGPRVSALRNEGSTRNSASDKRIRQLSLQHLPPKKRLRIGSIKQYAETFQNSGLIDHSLQEHAGRYHLRQSTKCSYNYDHEEVASLKNAVCNFCGKGFGTKDALRRHKVKHSPQRYGCDKCDATFRKEEYLLRHKNHHLSPDEWQFQCRECGDKFPLKSTLRSHQKQGHTRIPSFTCTRCDRSFFSKAAVESHKSFVHNSISGEQ